ncbi:MAG: FimV/HubP family polar landmark protein [Burkholderiaceae bacterium]
MIGESAGDLGLAAAETAVAPAVDSSRWQEMATKLDLASAYEEIGDKEGARELLEEVLKGGDTAQQQKARSMLAKIG